MPDEAATLVISLDANDAAYSADKSNLSEGAFRVVYTGTKILGEIPVVIKFLKDEYRTYQVITDRGKTQVDSILRVYSFGPIFFHNVLVIDHLRPSLESIFAEREGRFTVKTVVILAKRILGVVERVYAKGIVYRDLKPDNFVLGRPGTLTANIVHLIDFGIANRYKDLKTELHIPYREGTPLLGTAKYISIYIYLRREQSRRDDLELLWQGIKAPKKEKNDRIKQKKQEITIEDICTGFPVEFSECLWYVRHLDFDDEPDYVYL
ncbi:hypothetical protein MYCTH_97963 [Thermothelomyces thermophilus ATCC 42464]|uniref:non-specific serine/threonine protein kinase n=1 Tax=Thermothelomyces thermophilus (strain ATCC 42464 / BCRC 31852 / DSM 1799) TaxID=573729 RepID=G2QM33_THET4|nr:uncharacterized protein MYCTH_97963 [Thermothelomyces thermophilus ATCC 42464]AEO61013.1 hypothetical protein MYCTH_97963 [Thermothelomyces thermophilus ATCC 42464]